eukprot:TRINITY_DN1058_c0_g1_i5.p1 TRINITY_DN1058_c0_g1~~TRINITY_DN1058_c0_g1_i5.p1  ORF type:complete len:210 (-),score=58.40 TRINITY_DN1058_c0_g1_i5:58-687(-)
MDWDDDDGDLRVDRRKTDPHESKGRDRFADEPLPRLYSIHRGRVASIRDFGVFVRMDGHRRQGMVHKSQLASYRVENVAEFTEVEANVFVKVIGIESGTNKVSLSMKYADQTTGEDLDENNVQLSLAQTKSKRLADEPAPMTEEQIYANVVCEKCNGKGHAARDCYGGGVKYDLVEEDVEAERKLERALKEAKEQKTREKQLKEAKKKA